MFIINNSINKSSFFIWKCVCAVVDICGGNELNSICDHTHDILIYGTTIGSLESSKYMPINIL